MIASSDLPRGDAPTLTLDRANEDEILTQWKANGEVWKGALTLEAYIRREQFLLTQKEMQNGGIAHWVLVDTTAMNRVELSGCETYRMDAIVANKGKVEDVRCFGIGSVFCPPDRRRRGYAGRMMQELSKKLETWGGNEQKPCLFSVLYSDIGKEFYNTYGWEPFNSSHISLPPTSNVQAGKQHLPGVQPLYADDLSDLCAIDEKLLRQDFAKRAVNSSPAVALVPDVGMIRRHHAREDFVAQEIHGKTAPVKGGIVGTEPGKRVWAYWTRMWYNTDPAESKENKMHILRLVIEEHDAVPSANNSTNGAQSNGAETVHKYAPAIAALLRVAQQQAHEWHMESVEIWNPAPVTVEAATMLDPNAEVVDRESDSITSLKWYGERPEGGKSIAESIEWVGNEKFGWC